MIVDLHCGVLCFGKDLEDSRKNQERSKKDEEKAPKKYPGCSSHPGAATPQVYPARTRAFALVRRAPPWNSREERGVPEAFPLVRPVRQDFI